MMKDEGLCKMIPDNIFRISGVIASSQSLVCALIRIPSKVPVSLSVSGSRDRIV